MCLYFKKKKWVLVKTVSKDPITNLEPDLRLQIPAHNHEAALPFGERRK